jgi:hypothetical protein
LKNVRANAGNVGKSARKERKKSAARRREDLNEGTVISAPGPQSVASRRYVSPRSTASGGIPARGSNVRPGALHFIPDRRENRAMTPKTGASRGHHIRVIQRRCGGYLLRTT